MELRKQSALEHRRQYLIRRHVGYTRPFDDGNPMAFDPTAQPPTLLESPPLAILPNVRDAPDMAGLHLFGKFLPVLNGPMAHVRQQVSLAR
jgi:hypothetical protein